MRADERRKFRKSWRRLIWNTLRIFSDRERCRCRQIVRSGRMPSLEQAPTMIQLIHVSKQYDQRLALSDVTFEIGKGEYVLLMGPRGAGKSTLLRMLIGAEQPDEGEIFVHQKNVTALKSSAAPYLRRKVGTVFQDFRLLPKNSVFDNEGLPLLVQRIPP